MNVVGSVLVWILSVLTWILCGALAGRFVYNYREVHDHPRHPGQGRQCKDCQSLVGFSMLGGPVTVLVLLIWGVCHVMWAYGTRPTKVERKLVQQRRAEANEAELRRLLGMDMSDAQVLTRYEPGGPV